MEFSTVVVRVAGSNTLPRIWPALPPWPRAVRALLVQAPGKSGKSLRPKKLPHGGWAEGKLVRLEVFADLVDGVIGLSKSDGHVSGGGLLGLLTWAGARGREEDGIGLAAEAMAQDLKGAGGIAEISGDLSGGAPVDDERAQGLVLSVSWDLGLEKELPESA